MTNIKYILPISNAKDVTYSKKTTKVKSLTQFHALETAFNDALNFLSLEMAFVFVCFLKGGILAKE